MVESRPVLSIALTWHTTLTISFHFCLPCCLHPHSLVDQSPPHHQHTHTTAQHITPTTTLPQYQFRNNTRKLFDTSGIATLHPLSMDQYAMFVISKSSSQHLSHLYHLECDFPVYPCGGAGPQKRFPNTIYRRRLGPFLSGKNINRPFMFFSLNILAQGSYPAVFDHRLLLKRIKRKDGLRL